MNRRSVLRFLGATPIMGRGLEAKLKHDLSAGQLSGIHGLSGMVGFGPPSDTPPPTSIATQAALKLPWFRDELRSLLCEQNKRVGVLDPDLAVLKSLSLSAKLYYQRQRNVELAMQSYEDDPPWQRINSLFNRVRGLLGA